MNEWEDWIIYGGKMPKFLKDIPEVPYPKGFEPKGYIAPDGKEYDYDFSEEEAYGD